MQKVIFGTKLIMKKTYVQSSYTIASSGSTFSFAGPECAFDDSILSCNFSDLKPKAITNSCIEIEFNLLVNDEYGGASRCFGCI